MDIQTNSDMPGLKKSDVIIVDNPIAQILSNCEGYFYLDRFHFQASFESLSADKLYFIFNV